MPGAKPPTTTPPAFVAQTARPAAPAAPQAPPAVAAAPAAPVAKAPAPAQPAVAAVSASAAGGPPPVEEFRKDLLAVISERTGYPEDMLDEELPLEAGLGIDSIKTVEIFSTLKKYHPFMRDEERDEEETLAEFTKLKTIKDIIDSYAKAFARLAGSGGGSPASSSVERHVLTTASAPAGEASKKNSLAST
jgi:acyl carrier protein